MSLFLCLWLLDSDLFYTLISHFPSSVLNFLAMTWEDGNGKLEVSLQTGLLPKGTSDRWGYGVLCVF